MTFPGFDHVRQEGTDKVPLAENVNVEDLTERFGGSFENGIGYADAGVVYQNARAVKLRANLIGGVVNLLRRGYIAVVECNVGI